MVLASSSVRNEKSIPAFEKFVREPGSILDVVRRFNEDKSGIFFPSYLRSGKPIMIHPCKPEQSSQKYVIFWEQNANSVGFLLASQFYKHPRFQPIDISNPHHVSILFGDNHHLGELQENDTVLYLASGTKTNYAFVSRIENGLYTLKNEKGKEFLFNIPAGAILRKIEQNEQVPKRYRTAHFKEDQMQLEL